MRAPAPGQLAPDPIATAPAAPAPASSGSAWYVLGGLGIAAYLLYRHFKKRG